jgi:large exoprotein involved in heme utilization and adhesion
MLDSSIDVFSYSLANAGTIDVIAEEISIDTTTEGTSGLSASNHADLDFAPEVFDVAEEGRSGNITLTASKISLNHDTDISINTNAGNGGAVVVSADEFYLLNGADINSIPTGPGQGGDIQVDVTGTFLIEGEDSFAISSGGITTSPVIVDLPGFGTETGPAGAITVSAGSLIVGQKSQILSASFSNASAGSITLSVGTLEVKDGGEISSSAGANGPGADIIINADQSVTVRGTDPVFLLDSSSISADASFSETAGDGEGGSIQINSPFLVLEHGGAISSETSSAGAGGVIDVSVGELVIRSGGTITTDSISTGSAGAIHIDSKSILLSNADAPLVFQALGGAISSKAVGTGTAGTIDIAVGDLSIQSGGKITTASFATAPAGAIHIDVSNLLLAENAQITTSANLGDGGPIELKGGSIVLRDTVVTTSVEGAGGDGGDILVSADALVLDTGFIQANTAGTEARGGNILIDTPFFIPSGGTVQVGGTVRQSFQSGSGINVIQAAAPDGVSGDINITSPELDVSTALLGLSTQFGQVAQVVEDPCQITRGRQPTSLVWVGRGGVPQSVADPATVPLSQSCSLEGMSSGTFR